MGIEHWRLHEKKQFVQNSAIMSFSSLRDGYLKSLAVSSLPPKTSYQREPYLEGLDWVENVCECRSG